MSSLSTYRAENGVSQRSFAKMIGVDQSIVSRLENGMVPSLTLAARIERATSGKVPALSWIKEDAAERGAA